MITVSSHDYQDSRLKRNESVFLNKATQEYYELCDRLSVFKSHIVPESALTRARVKLREIYHKEPDAAAMFNLLFFIRHCDNYHTLNQIVHYCAEHDMDIEMFMFEAINNFVEWDNTLLERDKRILELEKKLYETPKKRFFNFFRFTIPNKVRSLFSWDK